MKTLVVGWDSASWRSIAPLLRRGGLPAVRRLAEEGVSGTLRSTVPALTPPAWTSMVTGARPERHGVYDFHRLDPVSYRMRPVFLASSRRPPLWDILAAGGVRVGIVNFPLLWPAPASASFYVSGFGGPEEAPDAFPESVRGIAARHGWAVHPVAPPSDAGRYAREAVLLMRRQGAAAAEMLRGMEWDVAWVVFQALDWVQHAGAEAAAAAYEALDGVLGALAEAAGDDANVILVSDHGMRPVAGAVYMDSLLEEWGYLARTPADRGSAVAGRLEAGAAAGARFLPGSLKRAVRSLLPDVAARIRRRESFEALESLIDWGRTRAFSAASMGAVRIHRKGLYARGTVAEGGECERLRAEIAGRLSDLRHPRTGERLCGSVVFPSRDGDSPAGSGCPDLVFEAREHAYAVCGGFRDPWFQPVAARRAADHEPEGCIAARGPCFGRGVSVDACVEDIAPTILHIHGLAVPSDADGRVVAEALAGPAAARPVAAAAPSGERPGGEEASSDRDDEAYRRRLGDLGYL